MASMLQTALCACWLLLLEEYGVTFKYLPAMKNVVADALSCLDIDSLKIQRSRRRSFKTSLWIRKH
jgi:hypothetical protein